MNLTVWMIVYNEETNLPFALESVVGWAEQVIVVDSFSQDRTVDIARSFGVEVYQNKFINHVQQRNWALEVPAHRHEWSLYIDADERVTPELRTEIGTVLVRVPDEVAGFEMRRRWMYLGRYLRHSGPYPWVLRLLRHGRSRFVPSARGAEYAMVQGKILRLRSELLHQDNRSLTRWIRNQNLDSTKVALALLEAGGPIALSNATPGEKQEGRWRALGHRVLQKLPLGLHSLALFLYAYLFRRGFLDSWQGLAWCLLHEFGHSFLVDLKLREFAHSAMALEEAKQLGWR